MIINEILSTPATLNRFAEPFCHSCATNRPIAVSYTHLKPSDISEQGIIVLRSSNIQQGKLSLQDIVRVNSDIPEKLYVQNNDILICARKDVYKRQWVSSARSTTVRQNSFTHLSSWRLLALLAGSQ